jgi:hypothetical protein
MIWFTVSKYPCHRWPRIFSVCCFPIPVQHSSFMTCHWIFNNSNTTHGASGPGTVYRSEEREFTASYFGMGRVVVQSLVFCVVFCWSLFVLARLAIIILSALLQFTDCDYPFGLFKLVLLIDDMMRTVLYSTRTLNWWYFTDITTCLYALAHYPRQPCLGS